MRLTASCESGGIGQGGNSFGSLIFGVKCRPTGSAHANLKHKVHIRLMTRLLLLALCCNYYLNRLYILDTHLTLVVAVAGNLFFDVTPFWTVMTRPCSPRYLQSTLKMWLFSEEQVVIFGVHTS